MTALPTSNQAQRRQVRHNIEKRKKLDELTALMDASGITVQDIQNHLEAVKQETTTHQKVLSNRQKRRANEQRRKALRLAQEGKERAKKERQANANKKKAAGKSGSTTQTGKNSK